jgi:cystathionine beta-lyase/cystathionine gamma-synthase
MDLSHIINLLGEDREGYLRSVSPPLMQTSNFCFPSVSEMRDALSHEMDVPFYSRGNNPTTAILRKKLAALEGSEECLVFGSGSAAIAAAVISSVKKGDHVVCVNKPYSWTNKLLNHLLDRFGVSTTMIDGTVVQNFGEAIRPETTLFMLESPNSMTFELQDLEAVCRIARAKGITTIVDNSYASPINQQPIKMGADIVVHSASKYLNGHSDLVAGVLCSSRKRCEKIFASEYMTFGGILSPHDAWLMIRGLRTLPIRMARVAESTPKVVSFLENHPKVEKVFYPFSPSHPQFELAKKQMKAPAGQFSVQFKAAAIPDMDRFCDRLNYFLLACSWGGYESLAFPVSALYTSANYSESTLPWNLVRFYVGLEDPEALIDDLKQALEVL